MLTINFEQGQQGQQNKFKIFECLHRLTWNGRPTSTTSLRLKSCLQSSIMILKKVRIYICVWVGARFTHGILCRSSISHPFGALIKGNRAPQYVT